MFVPPRPLNAVLACSVAISILTEKQKLQKNNLHVIFQHGESK